jgi:hypothetical protein
VSIPLKGDQGSYLVSIPFSIKGCAGYNSTVKINEYIPGEKGYTHIKQRPLT